MDADFDAKTHLPNVPDYAAEESARLRREFAEVDREVSEALEAARELPKAVNTVDEADAYTTVITRLRDLDKRIDGIRESEKMPHLRRGTAVDSFFFTLREKLFRRKKTDNAGAADILQARLHDYNLRREAEERAKREEEARIAREQEEAARRERERLEREQREAEEKAARARKAENKAAAEAAAREAEEAAERRRQEEERSRLQRQEAEAAARAKTADLTRERHAGGALNTMRDVPYVEIVDEMKLDPVALWPFVKSDEKLRALKEWSKATQHKKPMDGAIIEMRPQTVVRR